MTTTSAQTYNLVITEEERTWLLSFLQNTLVETHAEARRTDASGYKDQLHHEETMLRSLAEKVKKLGS